ncbi:MAG: hypothetical protein HC842_09885 [Cytophagales bacterium]|nr:hypothetical protein [Cytophagales bacterium]
MATLVELDGDEAYPEALTIGPDGNIYSGSFCTGDIWRITPAGELETWISEGINSVSGMAFAPDGSLYVVDHGDCNPSRANTSLKRVAPDGTVSPFAEVSDDTVLNGLTFDDQGRLYATDTQNGEVLVFDEAGQSRVWWELASNDQEARPTGIEFDAVHNALVIADSNNGVVYRVALLEDGSPAQPQILYQEDQRELDGLTLDDQGRVIFTLYDSHQIARIDEGNRYTILAENFREPSDVAFLDGRIYVTNFDSVSLAPIINIFVSPSLPFTIDVLDTRAEAASLP